MIWSIVTPLFLMTLFQTVHSFQLHSLQTSSQSHWSRIYSSNTEYCKHEITGTRIDQIEKLQGVWWTSNKREQLVNITSSFTIFDSSPMRVMYPFGGTSSIVTLRTFKLAQINKDTACWTSSPLSKTAQQHDTGQLDLLGADLPQAPTQQYWTRCTKKDEQMNWRSDGRNPVIPGFEQSLSSFMVMGGPNWSSSPADIVLACIKGAQYNKLDFVSSCLSSTNLNEKRRYCSILSEKFGTDDGIASSWSIIKYHHFSSDVCTFTIKVDAGSEKQQQREQQLLQFCLSRQKKMERGTPSILPTRLYDTFVDIELLAHGKMWMVDRILVPCY